MTAFLLWIDIVILHKKAKKIFNNNSYYYIDFGILPCYNETIIKNGNKVIRRNYLWN